MTLPESESPDTVSAKTIGQRVFTEIYGMSSGRTSKRCTKNGFFLAMVALKKKDFIYLFLEREKERERNINVWLPLVHPLLGTWPATQACVLTRNGTSDPLVRRRVLNPLSHTSQGSMGTFMGIDISAVVFSFGNKIQISSMSLIRKCVIHTRPLNLH